MCDNYYECDIDEKEVTAAMVDWSDLHEDYLQQILKKFTSVSDCLRFGAVCVSWRNILVPHIHPDLLNPQLPLLLIPTPPPPSSSSTVDKEEETNWSFHSTKEEEEKKKAYKDDITEIKQLPVPPSSSISAEEQTRTFYSVSQKRVYEDIEIKLPYNRYCRGSSHGWLITSGEEDTGFAVELINPLVSINNDNYLKIQLPPLTALPEDPNHDIYGYEYLAKAVLSANPLTNPKDYVVMAIYGGYCLLAYWKPGDQVWNPVPWSGSGSSNSDIIYHKGLYYIVNTQGHVYVCDLGSAGTSNNSIDSDHDHPHRPIKVWKIASSPIPKRPGGIEKYLVKLPSSGDLIMVHRFHTISRDGKAHPHSTIRFYAFKLLVEEKQKRPGNDEVEEVEEEEEEMEGPYSIKWRLMSNLENQMFFVGDNASMSLTTSEFSGGKPNHIYFTADCVYDDDGFLDMGVLDYEDWNIEQIHPMGSNDYILPVTTIWVEPTLRFLLHYVFDYTHTSDATVILAGVTVACLFVGLVGLGRIYLGMHSPINVVCGFLLGLVILAFWLMVNEYVDSFIVSEQNVASFWAALSILLLFAYPTPELLTPSFEYHTVFNGVALGILRPSGLLLVFYCSLRVFPTPELPTPSFELHTAFNGVALGIVSGVQQTYLQFHHEKVPGIFSPQFTIPVYMGRVLIGIPTILIVKLCSKSLAKWVLPVVCNTLGIPIRSSAYVPSVNGYTASKTSDKNRQSGYLSKLFLLFSQDSFDVDTGIRLLQYAGLAWSVVDLVPSLFSYPGL